MRFRDSRSTKGDIMHRIMIITIAVVSWLALSPAKAYANQGWDTVGAGCTITTNSVAANTSGVGGWGTVTHGSSATGSIYLICPITTAPLLTVAPTVLELLSYDSTATANNYVSASLIKQNKSTGGTTTIASISSDTCSPSLFCSASFSDTFAPGSYRYFVVVQLNRTSTLNTEYFYAVGIY
jgi:hypothetical protein